MLKRRGRNDGRKRAKPMAQLVFLGVFAAILVPLVILYFVIVEITLSNTSELVRDKAAIIFAAVEDHVTRYLDPIPHQLAEVADLLERRNLAFEQTGDIADMFRAALSATPQVATLSLAMSDGRIIRVFRNRETDQVRIDDWSDDQAFGATLKSFAEVDEPRWDGIFIAESVHMPFINYVFPIHRGRLDGILIASVSLAEFSRYIVSFQDHFLGTPFILRGHDKVLAHPALPALYEQLSDIAPLPPLDGVDDPSLAHMWSERHSTKLEAQFAGTAEVRVVDVGDEPEVFLYRELAGYDTEPWFVATHVPLSTIAPQLGRLELLGVAAIVALVSALILSAILSRALTRPIRRLAQSMQRLGRLDFSPPEDLSSSLFREVNDAFVCFDFARRSLKTFGRYVPRSLIMKLASIGDNERLRGAQVDVTVLFTDIVGFTAMSEDMSALQLEQFLNHHFALLNGCVEHCQGTTDKYIGDSLMAFWGAPERQVDHALKACQAAALIARALAADNDACVALERGRVKLRIGIHSGTVVAGDIGPEGRVNYTVVGDTVNIAERLEELAREIPNGASDVVAVISRETATLAADGISAESLGRHVLHGRRGTIEAMVLDLESVSGV
jgi:class 3 adenylate cyclase